MNRNVIMIMGGALVVAVLVAMVVQAMIGGRSKQAPTLEILVANKRLLVGEKIKPDDVRWQGWPDSALFKGIIRKSEHEGEEKLFVYDTPLRRTIESGEPVTTQAVIADVKGGNNFLAATIAPGMRAMAVAVKPESSVGGFLSPGDHVDVILAYTPKMDSALEGYSSEVVQRFASQTVLSNIRVLAVDQEAKSEGREAKVAKTVTLEVTKAGAERLALALSMGKISLVLRRIGEQDVKTDEEPLLTTDLQASTVMKKVQQLRGRSDSIRVYSGATVQTVPVRNAGDGTAVE